MKEYVELRVSEEWAANHLGPDWGEGLRVPDWPDQIHPSLLTRRVVIDTQGPELAFLRERLRQFPPGPANAFVFREYEVDELSKAPLLHLIITGFVEDSCGEEYGTVYNESTACPVCGFGRRQVSRLKLDLSKIPRKVDFATTIARDEELLVSESVAQIVRNHAITGCRLEPVEDAGPRKSQNKWYQLVITANAGSTVPPTRFAKDYFAEDSTDEFVCAEHGLSGLNLVSEVWVNRTDVEHADIVKTTNRYGARQGWLQPSPILLISQKFYGLLKERAIKGFEIEVVRLVP